MANVLITGANCGLGFGLIDIETSVAGLGAVIDNIDTYPPGAFVAFDGAIMPY